MPSQAEHLPFGSAVERGGHQVDDTHQGVPPRLGEPNYREANSNGSVRFSMSFFGLFAKDTAEAGETKGDFAYW
jgi:hypothetical protein